jgi:hypothetical protein
MLTLVPPEGRKRSFPLVLRRGRDPSRHAAVSERAKLPMTRRHKRDDACMVSLDEFERLRAEVCASGPPSSGDNLLGMEIDACAYMGDPAYADEDPELWQDMSIISSEDSEWLINGRASGKWEDGASITEALFRIWEETLRYDYQSAHTVVSALGTVTLLAVTQIGPGDFWVTAKIEVTLS